MAKKQRLLISFEEASELYEREKNSINSIAKSKGVHPNLLRRDLIYLGFKTRSEKQKINAFKYQANFNKRLEALALGIWLGEGTKLGKRVEVTNCNPFILKIWLAFLIKICNVDSSKLKLRISLHDSLLKEKARQYWSEELGMVINCFFSIKRTVPNYIPKQPMGTATLSFNSAFLIKKIQQRTVELASSLM
jgi:hypothetical protein